MKNIDFSSLDGRSLKTFLVVLEEGSISNAAVRLGVTQSAVSHLLDKLRLILGDPLFVRSGRGITPTERAIALREPIQSVLDGLKALTDERVFDPAMEPLEFTIAANDFQRELMFPRLVRQFEAEGVDARFRFVPAGIPATNLLRQARCDLLITPFPPEGPDIYQKRLFDDEIVCFFDAAMREAPKTAEEFSATDYLEVRFDDRESAMTMLQQFSKVDLGLPRVSVPNFSALAAFLRGSTMVTALPQLLSHVNLKGFAYAPLPFECGRLTMYMTWHKRDHLDPAHCWLRERLVAYLDELIQ